MEQVDEAYFRFCLSQGQRCNIFARRLIAVLRRHLVVRGFLTMALLFVVQKLLGRAGNLIADGIPLTQLDPYHIFAGISIHHIVQMLLALAVIAWLSRRLKLHFGFCLGDTKKGLRYLGIFAAAFFALSIALHLLMYAGGQLPRYDFPLNTRNIMGTLGFQLLLSGPSEEVLYRALPVPLLACAFGRSIPVKRVLTLEVLLSAVLFSLAHASWSLYPFSFQADPFQLAYALAMGILQGIVYQKTRSIVYPMIMHSFSNALMVGTGYLFTLL